MTENAGGLASLSFLPLTLFVMTFNVTPCAMAACGSNHGEDSHHGGQK